jgi:Holliday junction resolvase-like predicted endonuclease
MGDRAEALVAARLTTEGWRILATSVTVGMDEIDIISVEPGAPMCLVFVEVRSHASSRFGAPEESVDPGKLARTYRAAFALLRAGHLPDGTVLPRLQWRVDVVAVEMRPSIGPGIGGPTIRHLRGVAVP